MPPVVPPLYAYDLPGKRRKSASVLAACELQRRADEVAVSGDGEVRDRRDLVVVVWRVVVDDASAGRGRAYDARRRDDEAVHATRGPLHDGRVPGGHVVARGRACREVVHDLVHEGAHRRGESEGRHRQEGLPVFRGERGCGECSNQSDS